MSQSREPVILTPDRVPADRFAMPAALRRVYRAGSGLLVAVLTAMQVWYWNATTPSLGETSTLLIALAFAAVCAVFSAVSAEESSERLFWRLLTLIGALLITGRVYLASMVKEPPLPSFASFTDLGAAVVFLLAVGFATRLGNVARGARLRYLTDVSVGLVITFVVAFIALPSTLPEFLQHSWATRVTEAAYPAVGALMVFGTLANFVTPGRRDAWEWLLAGGLVIFGAASVLWPWWHADMNNDAWSWWGSPLLETLWVSAVGLIGCASMYRITGRHIPWRPPNVGDHLWSAARGMSEWVSLGLPLAAVVAFSLGAVLSPEGERTVYLGGAITLAVLVSARSGLVVLETERHTRWSDTDQLTGLLEPAAFRRHLDVEMELAQRQGDPVALAVFDVDDLAYFNQTRGYAAGDRLLRRVADEISRASVRPELTCRFGGDRFAIALPGLDARDASARAEELRRRSAPTRVSEGVTLSVGVAACPEHTVDADELLRLADDARRLAKCSGKDRVAVYDAELVASLTPAERARLREERSRLETVRRVAEAVDARSVATRGHSERVARLATMLATHIGLTARQARLIEIAALVHDVGKIGDPHTAARRAAGDADISSVRETHAELSARIAAAAGLGEVASWIRAHHERWDGNGWPAGTRGTDIPLGARMIALCNAVDRVCTYDSDGTPVRTTQLYDMLLAGMGTRFDPDLADRFVQMSIASRAEEAS